MRGRGRGGRRGQTERGRGSENGTSEGSKIDWKEVNPEIDTEQNTYIKVLFWAIEVGIVNSYLLYKQIVKPPLIHLQYRRQLILSLCETLPTGNIQRQLMHPLPTEERFQGRHYLETGSSRRRCLVCGTSKSGEHKKVTVYFCTTCSNHPAQHPVPCVRRYHELCDYIL